MIKLKENDVILFQGDSITDGNRGRNSDLNHVHGHSYQYMIAAELGADNIDKSVEFINRGISGNRISDLYGRWKEDCLNLKPTVLSILIGVNDMIFNWEHSSGSDPERYRRDAGSLNASALADRRRYTTRLRGRPEIPDSERLRPSLRRADPE